MSISKIKNFNKYFQEIIIVFVLLLLSLIPWIEFINANLNELDFIFNDNLIILLILYFFFIFLIYLILNFLTFFQKYSLITFVAISIWIFFQHSFLKSSINFFFQKTNLQNDYSSEIALILVISLICLFFFLIKKKIFYTNFFFLFLIINLFYSSIEFTTKFNTQDRNIRFEKYNNKDLTDNIIKKPNIYFFILDAMMPLNEFKDFYKQDLHNFENFYTQKNYIYFNDTVNFYPNTTDVLTSLFFLDEIFINKGNFEDKNLKPNIYKKFPTLLREKYNPKLISELNKLGYQFKWIGNSYAACSKYNYRYCLTDKKEEYIDFYLLQAFLEKTPLLQIFNKFTETNIIQKYLKINQRSDAIGKLKTFMISNKDYIKTKSTFYFIHHMHPHWPYKQDNECNYRNFPGKINFEGYKNSYFCVIKKITNMINLIENLDENAMVIFQSDHSWEMSNISESEYGNRKQIFNLVKNNINCNKSMTRGLNNVEIANYLIGCLKLD
jgi:hypothetical protein